MANEREDRRVRRTKAQLVAALTALLKQKDLKDISVIELTRLADVNRGTFYLHYRDMYDLFSQVEEELKETFLAIIDRYRKNAPVAWSGVMAEMFRFVADYAPSFEAVLHVKESKLLQQIVETVKPDSPEEWYKLFGGGNIRDYEYYYAFVTSGCIALVSSWFHNGRKETCEEMAALSEQLMTACTAALSHGVKLHG
jgi:AcrR family transcriptional regulator